MSNLIQSQNVDTMHVDSDIDDGESENEHDDNDKHDVNDNKSDNDTNKNENDNKSNQSNSDNDNDKNANIATNKENSDTIANKPPILFDVDVFMRLLLGSPELDSKIITIHKSMLKVVFYLPLYNKKLLESGKTLADVFDDICFVPSPNDSQYLISWSGLPIIHPISSELIQILPRVYPNPPDLLEIILSSDSGRRLEFYQKIFRNTPIPTFDHSASASSTFSSLSPPSPHLSSFKNDSRKDHGQIMAGFSVNAESLEGSVYLVDEENILGWKEQKGKSTVTSSSSIMSLNSNDSLYLASHLLNDQETLIARLRHPESKTIVSQIKK